VAVNYLRVSITDRCDLRCTYCTPMRTAAGAPRGDLLTFEEICAVVRVAAGLGIDKVRITGGEPLGRPGVAWLLGDLAAVPGLLDRALTTNGTRLKEFVPVLVPLGYRVNVHLDTLDPVRYLEVCGRGSPERAPGQALAPVLEGIEAALAAGLRVKINSVCVPGSTVQDALALARFGLERGADVRFIEAMPVAGGWVDVDRPEPASTAAKDGCTFRSPLPGCPGSSQEAHATSLALEESLKAAMALVPDGLDGVARVYAVPGTTARVGFITPSHARFCAGCHKLRLSSRGILRTCLFAEAGTDLRPFLRGQGPEALRGAVAEVVDRKNASAGREGCEIASMVGIGG